MYYSLLWCYHSFVDLLDKNAKKGRLVYVAGKMQTRRWKKEGEDSERFSTEILLVPGSRVQFLDRANGNAAVPVNGHSEPASGAPAQADDMEANQIPF